MFPFLLGGQSEGGSAPAAEEAGLIPVDVDHRLIVGIRVFAPQLLVSRDHALVVAIGDEIPVQVEAVDPGHALGRVQSEAGCFSEERTQQRLRRSDSPYRQFLGEFHGGGQRPPFALLAREHGLQQRHGFGTGGAGIGALGNRQAGILFALPGVAGKELHQQAQPWLLGGRRLQAGQGEFHAALLEKLRQGSPPLAVFELRDRQVQRLAPARRRVEQYFLELLGVQLLDHPDRREIFLKGAMHEAELVVAILHQDGVASVQPVDNGIHQVERVACSLIPQETLQTTREVSPRQLERDSREEPLRRFALHLVRQLRKEPAFLVEIDGTRR